MCNFPQMELPLALECLPFGIIVHVHVQLYPLLEARNGISHAPHCFMQIISF